MNDASFWKHIDSSRRKARGDLDAQLSILTEQLMELEPDDIARFGQTFNKYWLGAYTWDLWGAAYILGGGCSDDAFMDFRGWLISRGKKTYEDAMRDPDLLAEVVKGDPEDCLFEGFQYAALDAWAQKTGRPMEEFPTGKDKHPAKPKGNPWSEDDNELRRRYPKLWKKFG